jgi:5-methylcytosine-specific restriction enzyme A
MLSKLHDRFRLGKHKSFEESLMFELGQIYQRRELHQRYGGQQQGGISTPRGCSYVFLFTGSGNAYGYHDGWTEQGIFLYSGEGQVGAMTFTGGNKAIRDHVVNSKELHLFEQLGGGKARYLGRFACPSWEWRPLADRSGVLRQAIVFHLVSSNDNLPQTILFSSIPLTSKPMTLEELRRRALKAASAAGEHRPKDAKRLYYERSEAVRTYVLARAKGVCEACNKSAPFQRPDGAPYLEPHHIRRVSDGGPDHPRSVGAICPNCHREIHYGKHALQLNQRLQQYLEKLEPMESNAVGQ